MSLFSRVAVIRGIHVTCFPGSNIISHQRMHLSQLTSYRSPLAFAVSMFSFFRGLGQTLGIAIGGNIFQR